jgi:hypothetical protein
MIEELVFEVWLDPEPDGQMLPGLCLAGPMGDGFRALLTEHAFRADTLTGHSHFDVMTKYWRRQGWGDYRTEHPEDHEPFPEQWFQVQRAYLKTT